MGNLAHIGTPGRILVISVFVFLFWGFLPGCSPRIVEKVRTEYVYNTVHHHDTTIRRDSVYLREYVKGDTVFVEKYKDRYIFRDRWRDSIRIEERHDTTAVEVKVEKPLTWSQKAKIWAFPWLVLAVLGLTAWVTKKWWLRL